MSHDTHDTYHADTHRIGKSGLDLIHKSPAHYWAKSLGPNREREKPTAALQMGTAVHHAILEPNEFERRYKVMPDINRRTNAGKAEYEALIANAAALKITFLDAEDFTTCLRMRDAVWANKAAASLLNGGMAEQVVHFEEPNTGAACKCKPDWLSNMGVVVDIKTTEDASPAGFGKSAFNYRYHVQAPFYLDGVLNGLGWMPEGFVFIAVEKSAPYNVALYNIDNEIYTRGKRDYLADLNIYLDCLRTNTWPGYAPTIEPLRLPAWAK